MRPQITLFTCIVRQNLTRKLFGAVLVAFGMVTITQPIWADTETWNQTSGGPFSWNVNGAGNWTPDTAFPNSPTDIANVNNDIVGNETINLNQAITVNKLNLGDSSGASTFTIAPNGGSLTFAGTSPTLALSGGANTISAPITVSSPLAVTAPTTATLTFSGGITLNSSMSITQTFSPSTVNISGGVSSSGTLNLSGHAGTSLTLSNSSHSGGTNIFSGNVTFSGANTISGTTRVTGSAGLTVNNANSLGSSTLKLDGGGTLANLGGALTLNNPVQIWETSIRFFGVSNLNLGTGAVTLNSTTAVQTDGAVDFVVGGVISGSGFGVTKNGVGTLVVSGANTYDGATTINAGTLRLGATGVMPSGAGKGNVVLNGGTAAGTLNLNGFDTTINGLSGTTGTVLGQVINNATGTNKTLTLGNGDATATFLGLIKNNTAGTGTIALTKIGTGTQTLSGANTYSGTTTISGGILALTGAGTISSSLDLDGGTLDLTSKTGDLSLTTLIGAGSITGGKTVTVTSALGLGHSLGTINHTGDFTLGSSATTTIEINLTTSAFDELNVTSLMTYGGSLNVVFSGANPLGGNFNIFDFSSETGLFSSINFSGLGLGQTASFLDNTGVVLVTAVPEPTSITMTCLGVAGVLCVARRMRKSK